MEPLSPGRALVMNITLAMITFMYVLDYTVANVAIPYISGSLAVSNTEGTYVITSYAVGNAIALPLTGWLTRRFGSVKVMAISTLLFTLLSGFCGGAQSLNMLITSRFLQGLAAGPITPLSQGLIALFNKKENVPKAIACWATIIVVAPVVGPVLGGWICVEYTWPWIFFINLPIGFICTAVLLIVMKGNETATKKIGTDWLGILLLAIAVASMQIVLDKGQQWDWFRSPLIKTLMVSSVLGYLYLGLWEKTTSKPLFNFSVFRYRSFSVAFILIGISYSVYFGTVVMLPLWLQSNMGYNAFWAGVALCPLGIFPIFTGFFITKIMSKYGKLIPLMLCFAIFAFSCFLTAILTPQVDLNYLLLSRLIMGAGFGFFITPLVALSMDELKPEEVSGGSGLFQFIRAFSGGIGTSVFTTIWQRRTIYHHQVLSEKMNIYSDNVRGYFQDMQTKNYSFETTTGITEKMVNDQAALLAINDVFYVMFWLCVLLFAITLFTKVFLYRKPKLTPTQLTGGH